MFLPGLTADHRLFEKQIEYFEPGRNVLAWDAPEEINGLIESFVSGLVRENQ